MSYRSYAEFFTLSNQPTDAMYSGTVHISTKMVEASITFPTFEYSCGNSLVTKCELATNDEHEIRMTVELENVPTPHGVEEVALAVHGQAMRRLVCEYKMLCGETRVEAVQNLRPTVNPGDTIIPVRGVEAKADGCKASIIVSRSSMELKNVLERPFNSEEVYFELFNQARTSSNQVVEFLGYYQIISALLGDPEQKDIDEFILKHDSHAPRTPKPPKKSRKSNSLILETVYTKLRNEITHVRNAAGTTNPKDIRETKEDIAEYVSRLMHIAAAAIKEFA